VKIFVLLVIALLFSGCTAHVFSPPAMGGTLESVKPLAESEMKVGARVGSQKDGFGPKATTFNARFHRGFAQKFELGADFSLFHVKGVEQADQDLSPYVGAMRLGGKLEVLEHYMAIQGGVGGGFSDAGQFVSPDLGIILAVENPYLVPFVNVSGFVSQPINPKAVDVSHADEPVGTNVQEPKFTYGIQWSGGIRVPFEISKGIILAPSVGFGGTYLVDSDATANLTGVVGGLDLQF